MYPDWLKDALPITDADRTKLSEVLRNYNIWNDLRESVVTTEVLAKKAFIIEFTGNRRLLLLERIKFRHDLLRTKREMNEFYKSKISRETYRKPAAAGVSEERVAAAEVHKPGTSRRARPANPAK
jgi:hypothetical protein